MNRQKTIKIRIAVMVDMDGNWSATGWKGARDSEAIETAMDSDGLSIPALPYFLTIEVPAPRAIELTTAAVETGEPITEGESA